MTAMTMHSLNYKTGKMTYLVAQIVTYNFEELCFPDMVKTLSREADEDIEKYVGFLKKITNLST